MTFRDLIEARTHRAIFLVQMPEKKAQKLANSIFDYLDDTENNEYVTIETVNVVEGDTDDDSIIHVVGSAEYPEKNWKAMVKDLEKHFKALEFERFA